MRDLVEAVDVDGMTFLMHATSSSTVQPTGAEQTAAILHQRRMVAAQKASARATADPSTPGYTRTRGAPAIGRFHGIAEKVEEEEGSDVETGDLVSPTERANVQIGDNASASDGARGGFFGGVASSMLQKGPSASIFPHGGDEVSEHIAGTPEGTKETTDPTLVVFKTSWAMVEEVLWKGHVRGGTIKIAFPAIFSVCVSCWVVVCRHCSGVSTHGDRHPCSTRPLLVERVHAMNIRARQRFDACLLCLMVILMVMDAHHTPPPHPARMLRTD